MWQANWKQTGSKTYVLIIGVTHYTYFVSSVRSVRRGLQFSKQHSALFGQAEMSLRIVQAQAVTENGVALTPFEKNH